MQKIERIRTKRGGMEEHYKYALFSLLYGIFYLASFEYLEEYREAVDYQILHTALDDWIPFCELFIIPYFLWFAYVGITLFFVIFIEKEGFLRFAYGMVAGTAIFLFISLVFPNAQDLRPQVFERDNLFVRMVQYLYTIDTATNVLPSLHVYMSLIANMSICRSRAFSKRRGICMASRTLCLLIILATMFLKQHSVIDVVAGVALAGVVYFTAYRNDRLLNVFRGLLTKNGVKKEAAGT